MALKQFKPTTPGQRGLVLIDRTGLWKGKPEKALTEGLRGHGGRNNSRPHHRAAARRRAQAPLSDRRLQADEVRRAGDGGAAGVRSQSQRLHRADPLRGRRGLAYILAPQRLAVGDTVVAGRERRRQARQRAAAAEHSGGHDHPQRGDEEGQGRADRAGRRHLRAAHRQGPGLRPAPSQLGRAADGARRVHGDGRAPSPTRTSRTSRSARLDGRAGSASVRACAAWR